MCYQIFLKPQTCVTQLEATLLLSGICIRVEHEACVFMAIKPVKQVRSLNQNEHMLASFAWVVFDNVSHR